MKLLPFKEMVAMTKDGLNTAMAPIRARQANAKAELAKAKLDSEILELETKIQEQCTNKEIDFEKIADLIDEVELREHRRERFTDIINQLFPKEEPTV